MHICFDNIFLLRTSYFPLMFLTCTYLAKRLRELSSTKTGSYPHEFLCRTDCSACADYQPWVKPFWIPLLFVEESSRRRFARYVHVKNWNLLFYCSNIAKSENAMLWQMLSRLETCTVYKFPHAFAMCSIRTDLLKQENEKIDSL
jgi:hypothetical protein